MKILYKIVDIKQELKKLKEKGKIIGFVPTMGYLHNGHISLIKKSKKECDYTVVSIFVNPTQFSLGEDFDRYPRDFERDRKILENEKVDFLFYPDVKEMYKENFKTWVIVDEFSNLLEGKFRPGHFKGVCTIVIKLFNIIQPDRAYFGWKDAQQLIIIKKMVNDLNIPVEIIGCPIIREEDGLAESSRNVYLRGKEREKAIALWKGLQKIKELIELKNIKDTEILIREGKKEIESFGVEIQYLEIVDLETLKKVKKIEKNCLICGAIKIGNVRLIDNMRFIKGKIEC